MIGKEGWQKVESNSTGRIVRKLDNLDSIPGENLKTNIVSEIQEYSYEMIKDGITSFVPLDEANTDYQEIQQWISEGNTVIDNPPE